MPLEIAQAASASQLREFAQLPFALHASSPFWTPPILKQELELLDQTRHPFWQTARRELFLARRAGRVIGRIAAIVDAKHNAFSREACGGFGFFECANDAEAAHALLDAARAWLVEQGMAFMRGPLNPSTNYTCGMLVNGFERAPALLMPWNPSYYPVLLETWGLLKEEDLFAYVIQRQKLAPGAAIARETARLQADGRFVCRPARKKELGADIRAMLEIYRRSWAENFAFSPLSEAEAEQHVKELKGILDPDFFVLFEHDGETVAGMVALPDYAPLLRRLKGKIGLTAPWHFWQSRAATRKGLRIMLFGILPEYRLQGLPLLLLNYMLEKARSRKDLEWVEGSWILERNYAMNDLLEDFGGEIVSRYRLYRREIAPCLD